MGFENSAGLGNRNHYGPRKVNERFGGQTSTSGSIKQVEALINLADVISGAPGTSNALMNPAGGGELEHVIPAYAKILSAKAEVVTAIATTGGSAAASASLTLGLDKYSDGTAIDADGLIDATDGALTIASNDIAQPRGSYLRGNAAALISNYQYDGDATGAPVDVTYVEATSIGADAGQLYALLTIDDVTGMTAIAGKVRIIVEYLDERASGNSNYVAGGTKA